MYTRREFIGAVGPALAATAATLHATGPLAHELTAAHTRADDPPDVVAQNEHLWFDVSRAFTVDRSLVNLNNGGVSPTPRFVQEAMQRHLEFSNNAPPYTMWQILEPQREGVRDRLARQFGCDPEELAITRNASEGLQICQLGFDLVRGDEVLTTTQDYGRMVNTFKQRERRDGIVLKQIKLPVPCEDDAEVVRRFEQAIGPRTRLILMCHVINLTGQILPVWAVVQMARARGIPVIVDGAHSLAHFEFKLSDLDCDYFATSLHKWLFAPVGTGLLYVRRDKIKGLWPMQAAADTQDDNIRKFEEIGTHPAANALAIAEALTFHQGLGSARKEARLRFLRDYWAKRLLAHDRVHLQTSLDPRFSCGIATVRVDGLPTAELNTWLWSEHRILTTPIVHEEFEGLRVTPSVYTTLEELDRFVGAIEDVMRTGLPQAKGTPT